MPDRIGRYRVERRLGAGAFATVWLAEDETLESWVAIKVLADNWAHQADVRARFEQEAQVLRRADSERLVRIHDYGELPDGRPYQVMTYADGGTLAERMAGGPLPVRPALRIAADVARATADLHASGVLHRDLKPSNVLFGTVRGVERVLVADLGLAKAIAYASGFTVVAGTPGYMAPEQTRPGDGLDVRADVHAIGAMAYQMLTATTPNGAALAPSKVRPGISPTVDRIVLRAVATDRDRRWPSAAALADALDAAAAAPRRTRNRVLHLLGRTTGSLVAVAGLVLLGGALPAAGTPAGWVRVADESGKISVAVPSGWARQARESGWNPAAVGLPAADRPGVAVAADLGSWSQEYAGGPGVFAGTADGLDRATLPVHERCDRSERAIPGGRVVRWTRCAGTAISYSEALAGDVYLQIKQVDDADLTDEIVRAVHS
ncbi:serine/threonine protein kinase [Actinoplanes sp. KI2]|uniref:serine/threonine-protein kinase n=1 Tax=Actinoplanes sp. KI2 TaxID=2983315 RepID=UPI0021D5EFB7|nr:serine/threonine-protein kinase [Actinoplanes sp. KI2]MCU7729835.1 serine/threonine protein kinase [Actinoplanes sp. KI2]